MENITANVVTFATMKGGTGKTTVSYNIACMLARQSKVLAIDFDPQGNLSSNLKYDIYDETLPSVADIFDDLEADPYEIMVPEPLEQLPNLDLLPSTSCLDATELQLVSASYREHVFEVYMERNADFFNHYDYIIIDTAPRFGLITQNALFLTDHIVLVTDPDVNSPRGADIFLSHWKKARAYQKSEEKVDGLIINNLERTKISGKLIDYIDGHPVLSRIRFDTMIPHTTRFKECGEQNLPIFLLNTKSIKEEKSKQAAEEAFENLINEMKGKGIL